MCKLSVFVFTMRQSLDKLKPNFPFATAGSSIEKYKLFAFAFIAQFISSFFPQDILGAMKALGLNPGEQEVVDMTNEVPLC